MPEAALPETRNSSPSGRLLLVACALAVGFAFAIVVFVLFGGDADLEPSEAPPAAPARPGND